MGGGVYWEGGVIWLWCKWGMDWRRGCGKIRGGRSRWARGRGDGVS